MLYWKNATIMNSKEGGTYSNQQTLTLKWKRDLNSNYFPTIPVGKFIIIIINIISCRDWWPWMKPGYITKTQRQSNNGVAA